MESLRPRYVAATAKLREADDALVKGQLEDGPQLYLDAGQGFRDLVAGLNEHIAGLLAAGKRELEAGRPEGRWRRRSRSSPCDRRMRGRRS